MSRPQGIDVNHFHPVRDWDAVVGAGMTIFGAKATNGMGVDETFKFHRDGARRQPFELVTYYHFPTPLSSAVAQADRFAEAVGSMIQNERLVLDVEWDRHANWCPDIRFVEEFFQELFRVTDGRRALTYTSARVWGKYLGGAAWPGAIATDLWVPRYGDDVGALLQPEPELPRFGADVTYPVWPRWTLWQDSETFECPGVQGACDHDVYNGSLEDLRSYVLGSGTSVAPGG